MKKIVSLFVILTMMLSVFAVSSSAAGILVQSDFSDMERFTANFHAGAFYTDENLLFGYNEAKCLQTKGEWFIYDTCIEAAFADDEMSETERAFSVVYPNTNLLNYGRADGSYYMSFSYVVEEKSFYLTGGGVGCDKEELIVGPVSYEGIADDGSEFYSFGMSVTRGRIRCFIDNKLLIDYVDTADEYLIGIEDENTVPTALVYWNDGNFIQIKDVKIATPEFLYPMTPVADNTTPTDTSATETTTPRVTTTATSIVDVTDDKGNTMTDDSGNKVTETVIITEPPVADTNTGAVQGGNSTNTGDSVFVVVAAMVAAIGCALIVRKVSVR